MKDCTPFREVLMLSLRGEIDAGEKEKLDRHLAECESCRRDFDEFRLVFDFTEEGEPVPSPDTEQLLARTLQAIREEEEAKPRSGKPFLLKRLTAMALAAVVLIVAYIGFVLPYRTVEPSALQGIRITSEGEMILVPGGQFVMGDLFDEGWPSEKPLHPVQLDSFFLSPYEVTVEEYHQFVLETGYITASEVSVDRDRQTAILDMLEGRQPPDADMGALVEELIASGGCYKWDHELGRFVYLLSCTWLKPQFEQTSRDPVVCMSWIDSIHYCNWRSQTEGLPVAYDTETLGFLDQGGNPTSDVTLVKGYRLPTEAEWEYAAREGGKEVRFGNGKNIAMAGEINFNPVMNRFPYSREGIYRDRTTPVGRYKPNSLGLYDMSGNAWEWVFDGFGPYGNEDQVNPVVVPGNRRVVRGGRWGGDACEARVFHRSHFETNNRCNNTGFRLARSL